MHVMHVICVLYVTVHQTTLTTHHHTTHRQTQWPCWP